MKKPCLLIYFSLVIFLMIMVNAGGCSVPVKTGEISSAVPLSTASDEGQEVRILKVGDTAPLFTLDDIDGNTVSLSDYFGKKVIINIWILGCHGCTDEMPVFQEFYDKWYDSNPVIIGINTSNSIAMVKSFAVTNGLSFKLLVDSGGILDKSYSITGVPTTFFIDGKGVIQAIKDGMFENMEELEEIYNSY